MKRRVVLISGCSSGFGLLTAVEMVRRGFLVIATMRNLSKRSTLEAALSKLMPKTESVNDLSDNSFFLNTPHPLCKIGYLDVSNPDSISHCVNKVLDTFDAIDVLVNNAGSGLGGFAEDISLDEFRAQFETNFWGLVTLTKAVIPQMRKRRQGHVINVSSIAGLIGVPGLSSYCASKYAVEGFSESLRYELLPFNVWVSLVEPGTYKTNIQSDPQELVKSAFVPTSAYYEWGKTLLDLTLEQANSSRYNPQKVAGLIANISEKKHPNIRYVIGEESLYLKIKNFLPSFLVENLVFRFYRYQDKSL
ncbi:SDR family NAD(P)-dependent oxidoreductase [Gloeothece verrucosa]|uniref:Short-chain dehydrogenase/reductase SDR n=1 Tax=Gloeothece verrucosa (strain PCC 7822) TaxID=497965 RepID=E0U779_GLOV7|nr:SDR family NAD(P)-dependent oxidoreductase [Gloeothece verrucosa]ADN12466.1 short-chain dehydrogenase/reductase SDR [Gloeothece verrucosa PCC 7822]